MSIYKHKQAYGFTVFRWLRGFFFHTHCDSYLLPPDAPDVKIVCTKKLGHRSRHQAGQMTWGIGDNLV